MPDKRIIKKYLNRRLYDTGISKYITIRDIRNLVVDGIEFSVKDVKTGEDLTCSILIQIIAEQEHNKYPVFTENALIKIIRSYGHTRQLFLSDYLEKCLSTFYQQQQDFQKTIHKEALGIETALQQPGENEIRLWKEFQENFFRIAAGFSIKDPNNGS